MAALYAVMGAGGLALEKLRQVRLEPLDTLPARTSQLLTDVGQRVATTVSDVPTLVHGAKDRLPGRVTETYVDLATRGQVLVERIRETPEAREIGQSLTLTARRTKEAAETLARSVRTRAGAGSSTSSSES